MRLTSLACTLMVLATALVGQLALPLAASAQISPPPAPTDGDTAADSAVPPSPTGSGAAASAPAPADAQSSPVPFAPNQLPPPEGAGAPPSPPYAAPPNLRWMLVDPTTLQPPPEPGFHKHDGFFMRFHMGVAIGEMRGDMAAGELEISGKGISEAMAFGGAINDNLVLYGEYFLEGIFAASASGAGRASGANEVTGALLGLSPGAAYYFVPSNLCVFGAFGMVKTFADEENKSSSITTRHQSGFGFGGNLGVGKEWWVSTNWALGAAVRATLAHTHELETGYPWRFYSIAVLFSTTYN
jgi:hypothetical protein